MGSLVFSFPERGSSPGEGIVKRVKSGEPFMVPGDERGQDS